MLVSAIAVLPTVELITLEHRGFSRGMGRRRRNAVEGVGLTAGAGLQRHIRPENLQAAYNPTFYTFTAA